MFVSSNLKLKRLVVVLIIADREDMEAWISLKEFVLLISTVYLCVCVLVDCCVIAAELNMGLHKLLLFCLLSSC
jgi:hypothetical protein